MGIFESFVKVKRFEEDKSYGSKCLGRKLQTQLNFLQNFKRNIDFPGAFNSVEMNLLFMNACKMFMITKHRNLILNATIIFLRGTKKSYMP